MKTIHELDNLIDGSAKRGLLCTPGSAARKEQETEVCFYKECKTVLIALSGDGIQKQLSKVKNMLEKYQAAKKEAERNTSSAKVKAALNDVNTRFKPEQLRKQERILLFIFQD